MTVQRSAKATRLFGWLLAAAVAGLCLGLYPLLEWYQPLLFLTAIMTFLSLTVSVVRSVMGAAVQMREENDLTV